ncbi:MAG: hypothetical protein MJ072_05995, partial [Clostridia bacterium]|nr:hypothetical protein [Clostridia bacterium]
NASDTIEVYKCEIDAVKDMAIPELLSNATKILYGIKSSELSAVIKKFMPEEGKINFDKLIPALIPGDGENEGTLSDLLSLDSNSILLGEVLSGIGMFTGEDDVIGKLIKKVGYSDGVALPVSAITGEDGTIKSLKVKELFEVMNINIDLSSYGLDDLLEKKISELSEGFEIDTINVLEKACGLNLATSDIGKVILQPLTTTNTKNIQLFDGEKTLLVPNASGEYLDGEGNKIYQAYDENDNKVRFLIDFSTFDFQNIELSSLGITNLPEVIYKACGKNVGDPIKVSDITKIDDAAIKNIDLSALGIENLPTVIYEACGKTVGDPIKISDINKIDDDAIKNINLSALGINNLPTVIYEACGKNVGDPIKVSDINKIDDDAIKNINLS